MDLTPWGDPPLGERLTGGHRNDVYRAGDDWVARRSRRTVPSLEWELALLSHLSALGFAVPAVVPTRDGRTHAGGVVVQRWLPGTPPADGDWPAVAAELRRLHAATTDWPARPDLPGTRALLRSDRGGDVDLTRMPPAVVDACRRAWRAVAGPTAVVHGDPNASNVRISAGRVGLLDWDEARVDLPWLDLADLPGTDAPPSARAAVDAWEVANAWLTEPSYARERLSRLPVHNSVDNPQGCG